MHHIFHISYAQKFKGYGNLTCVGEGGSLKLKTVLHFEGEQISWNKKGNSDKRNVFALQHFNLIWSKNFLLGGHAHIT